MPNIELHGFGNGVFGITERVTGLLASAPYAGQLVVTTSAREELVYDLFSEQKPFIRILASDQSVADDIVQRLDELDIDIEIAPLTKFVARRSDRITDTDSDASATTGMSPKYRSMIYAAVATFHFYRASIATVRGEYSIANFRERNSDVVTRVFEEVQSLFGYELSSEQLDTAINAYLSPGQSVHDTEPARP